MNMPATAMVFAAGLGTRMRPLTNTRPKPLIEVAGKTLLDRTLDRLADAGVQTAIVNVHYLPDMVIDHLRQRTHPRIIISDEREKLLDQGGGIRHVLAQFDEAPFFICNTDAFWAGEEHDNLRAMAQMWDANKMDVLLLLADRTSSIGVDGPGDFFLDTNGRLTRRGAAAHAPCVYSGVGIIKPQLFAQEDNDVFGLAKFFFAAGERERLYGLELSGTWLHVGRPQTIAEAEHALGALASAP